MPAPSTNPRVAAMLHGPVAPTLLRLAWPNLLMMLMQNMSQGAMGGGISSSIARALGGGAMAFAVAETIGLAAAFWPEAWLRLFGAAGPMLEAGSAYLRTVGPVFGFFGMGFTLYFASQGAGRLAWAASMMGESS